MPPVSFITFASVACCRFGSVIPCSARACLIRPRFSCVFCCLAGIADGAGPEGGADVVGVAVAIGAPVVAVGVAVGAPVVAVGVAVGAPVVAIGVICAAPTFCALSANSCCACTLAASSSCLAPVRD